MADHADHTRLGASATLFFTRSGSVESFPLPRGRRRWIVQTERFEAQPERGLLEALVEQRTGITLKRTDKTFESTFRVCRLLAESELPIAEVAQMAGFEHPEYMSRLFKKKLGTTPGEFRKHAGSTRLPPR